jgi:DNA-binding MarR family transcriptional regulator
MHMQILRLHKFWLHRRERQRGTLDAVTTREDDEDLAESWHDVMCRYHKTTCALDRALLAGHGVTVSEFEVLQQLGLAGAANSGLKMHTLADNVHLSQSALSRVVGRLEEEALVERSMCVEDRRSVWVRITKAGTQRFLEARPTHRAVLREQATVRA